MMNTPIPPLSILLKSGERSTTGHKPDIPAATGITDSQWNAAITNLLASNKVERQGEKRGTRYRFLGDRT